MEWRTRCRSTRASQCRTASWGWTWPAGMSPDTSGCSSGRRESISAQQLSLRLSGLSRYPVDTVHHQWGRFCSIYLFSQERACYLASNPAKEETMETERVQVDDVHGIVNKYIVLKEFSRVSFISTLYRMARAWILVLPGSVLLKSSSGKLLWRPPSS